MEVIHKYMFWLSMILSIEANITDIYKDCGKLKGCYGFPEDCISGSNCSVVMTYTGIEEQLYKMELAGKGDGNGYVAMGLSFQAAMGNGTVMACTSNGIERSENM